MSHAQINPLLVQMLTNREVAGEGAFPSVSSLPGKYVQAVRTNKKSIAQPLKAENYHMLTCKSCGRKGKYDVGTLVLNMDKKGTSNEHIQMTGYFRCKHCNDAGNWELPNGIFMKAMAGVLPILQGQPASNDIFIGENLLFDGTWHQYATDAEEHLLHLLMDQPDDSFIWNRLGNLYNKGKRPELAMSVFEHSIMIDKRQIESHYTIGDMLAQIGDLPNAGHHFHQMLIFADTYTKLPAAKLREMLAIGLQLLFEMYLHTDGEVPFLPSLDEKTIADKGIGNAKHISMGLEISPDDTESFFPLAEMYMGERSKEIPLRERTLNVPSLPAKRKKKKLRKRRRRK